MYRAVETLHFVGHKELWVVTDGGYTQRPFIRPALALEVTLAGRLRKDSALHDLPPPRRPGQLGPNRKYGTQRIFLVRRAARRTGWSDVTCVKPARELTHREDSPWDDPTRRPSHADRRKALQAACLAEELARTLRKNSLPRQFRDTLKRLLRIAV